jgi:3D (Asp-Asp-Asp) domain-containing protein
MNFFIALTTVMISVACSSGFFFGFYSGQHQIKQKKVNQEIIAKIITRQASVTKYVATGNHMSNGEHPYVGAVATSDYRIAIGTKVLIFGQVYVVKDRTAAWIHLKHGLTFDIFSEETVSDCRKFGRKKTIVTIEIRPELKKIKKNTSAKK